MTYILQEQHRQYFMGKAEPNTRVQSPGEHIWPCRRQSWRLAAVALDFRALLPPTWHGKGVRSSSQAFTLLFSHPGSPCGLFFGPVCALASCFGAGGTSSCCLPPPLTSLQKSARRGFAL